MEIEHPEEKGRYPSVLTGQTAPSELCLAIGLHFKRGRSWRRLMQGPKF